MQEVGLFSPENGLEHTRLNRSGGVGFQSWTNRSDGAVASFILRAVSDTLPPEPSHWAPNSGAKRYAPQLGELMSGTYDVAEAATVAIYGSVLTKEHLDRTCAGCSEVTALH